MMEEDVANINVAAGGGVLGAGVGGAAGFAALAEGAGVAAGVAAVAEGGGVAAVVGGGAEGAALLGARIGAIAGPVGMIAGAVLFGAVGFYAGYRLS